jgi:hypothetical protein
VIFREKAGSWSSDKVNVSFKIKNVGASERSCELKAGLWRMPEFDQTGFYSSGQAVILDSKKSTRKIAAGGESTLSVDLSYTGTRTDTGVHIKADCGNGVEIFSLITRR